MNNISAKNTNKAKHKHPIKKSDVLSDDEV